MVKIDGRKGTPLKRRLFASSLGRCLTEVLLSPVALSIQRQYLQHSLPSLLPDDQPDLTLSVSKLSPAALHAWWEKAPAPVFIIGVPRAGTTRIYDVFANIPAFKRQRGKWSETHVIRHLQDLASYRDIGHLYEYIGTPSREESGLEDFLSAYPKTSRASRLQAFFFFAQQYGGMQRIVEKTPYHSVHIALLATAFPKASFVFMFRDPALVYASMRSRSQKEKQIGRNETWLDLPVDAFTHYWNNLMLFGLRHADWLGERFLPVDYECFTNAPSTVFFRLAESLDMDFKPEYLEFSGRIGSKTDRKLGGNIQKNQRDPADILTRKELEIIRRRCNAQFSKMQKLAFMS